MDSIERARELIHKEFTEEERFVVERNLDAVRRAEALQHLSKVSETTFRELQSLNLRSLDVCYVCDGDGSAMGYLTFRARREGRDALIRIKDLQVVSYSVFYLGGRIVDPYRCMNGVSIKEFLEGMFDWNERIFLDTSLSKVSLLPDVPDSISVELYSALSKPVAREDVLRLV